MFDGVCYQTLSCVNGTQAADMCVCQPGYAGQLCETCATGYINQGGVCYAELTCGANQHQEADACVCDAGFGFFGTNECHAALACKDGTQQGAVCVCNGHAAGDLCDTCEAGYGFHGTNVCYADLACANGSQTGGACVCTTEGWTGILCDTPASCDGYEYSTCPVGYAQSATCLSGDTTKLQCNNCAEGYGKYGTNECHATISCGTNQHQQGDTCVCDTGYEMVGGVCTFTSCPTNQYKVGSECLSCPENSTSPVGSTSINQCTCNSGYVMSAAGICVEQQDTSKHIYRMNSDLGVTSLKQQRDISLNSDYRIALEAYNGSSIELVEGSTIYLTPGKTTYGDAGAVGMLAVDNTMDTSVTLLNNGTIRADLKGFTFDGGPEYVGMTSSYFGISFDNHWPYLVGQSLTANLINNRQITFDINNIQLTHSMTLKGMNGVNLTNTKSGVISLQTTSKNSGINFRGMDLSILEDPAVTTFPIKKALNEGTIQSIGSNVVGTLINASYDSEVINNGLLTFEGTVAPFYSVIDFVDNSINGITGEENARIINNGTITGTITVENFDNGITGIKTIATEESKSSITNNNLIDFSVTEDSGTSDLIGISGEYSDIVNSQDASIKMSFTHLNETESTLYGIHNLNGTATNKGLIQLSSNGKVCGMYNFRDDAMYIESINDGTIEISSKSDAKGMSTGINNGNIIINATRDGENYTDTIYLSGLSSANNNNISINNNNISITSSGFYTDIQGLHGVNNGTITISDTGGKSGRIIGIAGSQTSDGRLIIDSNKQFGAPSVSTSTTVIGVDGAENAGLIEINSNLSDGYVYGMKEDSSDIVNNTGTISLNLLRTAENKGTLNYVLGYSGYVGILGNANNYGNILITLNNESTADDYTNNLDPDLPWGPIIGIQARKSVQNFADIKINKQAINDSIDSIGVDLTSDATFYNGFKDTEKTQKARIEVNSTGIGSTIGVRSWSYQNTNIVNDGELIVKKEKNADTDCAETVAGIYSRDYTLVGNIENNGTIFVQNNTISNPSNTSGRTFGIHNGLPINDTVSYIPKVKNTGDITVSSAVNDSAIVGISGGGKIENFGTINVISKGNNTDTVGLDILSAWNKTETELNDPYVINDGEITVFAEGNSLSASGIEVVGRGVVVSNTGAIKVSTTGTNSGASGIRAQGNLSLYNDSSITVNTTGADSYAYGIYAADGATVYNRGTITVNTTGADSYAYGIRAYGSNTRVYNTGTITVNGQTATGDAVADACDSGTCYYIEKTSTSSDILVQKYVQGTDTGSIPPVGATAGWTYVTAGTAPGFYTDISGTGTKTDPFVLTGFVYTSKSDDPLIFLNNGAQFINGGVIEVPTSLSLASLGGENMSVTKTSSITAPTIYGLTSVDASFVQDGFDTTYTSENAFNGINDGIGLTSNSYLFNASLNSTSDTTHDIVMTMKSFDDVTSNKSLAAFLAKNYAEQNNEAFFNELKSIGSAGAFTSALNHLTAGETLSRFTHEDLTAWRDVNTNMNALMFANMDQPLFQNAGSFNAFSFQNDSSSSAQFALAHKRISPYAKIGYAMSTTHLSSDDHRSTTRRNDIFQAFTPIAYDRFGWQLISTPQIGFARAHYSRKGYNGTSYDGVIEKRIAGFMNEARYPVQIGSVTFAPTVELNALVSHQKGNETRKAYSLTMPADTLLSVEAGAGFHLDTQIKGFSLTAGTMLYREFADPYNMKVGMNGMDGSFDLFDEQKKYRAAADFGFGYDAGPLHWYGSLRHFVDTNNRSIMNTGINVHF